MSKKDKYLKELEEKLNENNITNTKEIVEKYRKRYEFSLEAEIAEDEIIEMLGTPDDVVAKYVKNENKTHHMDEKDVKYKAGYNLIVKTICDDIIIKASSDDKNHVVFDRVDPENYEIITDSEKGIYINYKKSKYLSLNRRSSGEITISIPKDKWFDRIDISNASADLNVIDLRSREAKIQIASGDAEIHQIEADNVNINTVSGDIKVYKINAKSVALNTVSGDIAVNYIDSQTTRIDSVSGDVNVLKLEGEYKTSSVSGDVMVNGEECTNITKKIKGVFKRS